MIGRTVSHYRITRELGSGGMGTVYLAEDLKLKRDVALKFLSPDLTRDPVAKARFLQEARAAAAFHHPNICTVYEIDEVDDGMFIAMACIEGGNLDREIKTGPLDLDRALFLAIQIADGLRAAHEQGIVHRDVKPPNILLGDDGQARITDFGLALAPERTKLTQANTTLGTFPYMSPEQALGEEVDRRADIWSLGVVLYEMICGRRPFRGDNQQAVVHALLNREPDPLTGVRTGVPLELERIVGKALTKPRDARYQHMDDLIVDLQAVRDGLRGDPASLEAPTVTMAAAQAAPPRKKRPIGLIAGIVAGAVIIGALAVGLKDRISGPGEPDPIRSLAVLPFQNMMGDSDQDFFVEGLHESLITELSKVGSLQVISRTSAMHYKGTDLPLTEIARQLDVDALVEGSVLRVGDRVRVTAQLIRGDTDEHIWAEDYDRVLKDVLNLLSEMAGMIAGEIDLAVAPQQKGPPADARTVDPAVYELVLRGRQYLNRFNYQDALKARDYFEQAIAADPDLAEAHSFLAATYIIMNIVGQHHSSEVFPPARASAERALELDPNWGGAHSAMGYIQLYYDWDWDAAERSFLRALELNPGDSYALHGMADVRTMQGHADQAVEYMEHSRQLDPFSYITNMPLVGHLYLARRYEVALAEIAEWRELTGNPHSVWYFAFQSLAQLGRDDEAMAELRRSTTGRDPEYAPLMEAAYAEAGIPGAARVCAERLVALRREEYIDPVSIANYYAYAGDADETIAWLEACYDERVAAAHVISSPSLDVYREDPRFEAVLRKMGIPEEAWERLGGG